MPHTAHLMAAPRRRNPADSITHIKQTIRKRTIPRSEEHTSELQSPCNLVCRLLLEKKKNHNYLATSPIAVHRPSRSSLLQSSLRSYLLMYIPVLPTPTVPVSSDHFDSLLSVT